jgi:predicted helicase
MKVDIRHVDGTMNAVDRGNELAWLRSGSDETENVCRVLTNVRCLSEGVDVPSLDAVMFLTPRGSQVDIVQSVGRVMRKAAGKKLGYIILPVVVPAGMSPEAALADNKRFEVVWEVLQALRAHDDRFNAMVNQLDLNKKKNSKVVIIDGGGGSGSSGSDDSTQLTLPFGIEEWRDAIYARIVKKVGERRYWETWAKDVAKIAEQHIARITGLLADEESSAAKEFEAFLAGLRGNLNDGITRADAIDMLAQHLITRPVFEALFGGYDFAATTPSPRRWSACSPPSTSTTSTTRTTRTGEASTTPSGCGSGRRQRRRPAEAHRPALRHLLRHRIQEDRRQARHRLHPRRDRRLHPRSADDVLREHFGQGSPTKACTSSTASSAPAPSSPGCSSSGSSTAEDLARKYAPRTARQRDPAARLLHRRRQHRDDLPRPPRRARRPRRLRALPRAHPHRHVPVVGGRRHADTTVFVQNNARLEHLKSLPIQVIVGNPPYSSGQDSANDNNRIHYSDIGDYLSRDKKLSNVAEAGTFSGLDSSMLNPNSHGEWLTQRTPAISEWLPLGAKHGDEAHEGTLFYLYGRGLETGRDAWVYQFSQLKLTRNARKTIHSFNEQVDTFIEYLRGRTNRPQSYVPEFIDLDATRISWTLSLKNRLAARRPLEWRDDAVLLATYRPFMRQRVYFGQGLSHITGQTPNFFPTAEHANVGFTLTGPSSHYEFCLIAANAVPDLHLLDTGQFFARWRYEKVTEDEGMLAFGAADQDGEVVDGYRRIDNITDHALATFRTAYGDAISTDDIFYYCYGLLHSPDYRETYAADLKKMLPRIPLVTDPWPFIAAGRALSDLHLGYETVTPYPLTGLDDPAYPADDGDAAYRHFRVEKMTFAKVRDPRTGKLVADKLTDRLQLDGSPSAGSPRSGVPVHARVTVGDRMDRRPLPGQDRQGLRHRQRPQRLVARGRRTRGTSSTYSPASSPSAWRP